MSQNSKPPYVTAIRSFPDRAVILKEGAQFNGAFQVLSGKVKVRKAVDANSQVTLAVLQPGDVFGEMSLLGEQKAPSASVTAEGSVSVGILDTTRLQDAYAGLAPEHRDLIRAAFISLRKASDRAVRLAAENSRAES